MMQPPSQRYCYRCFVGAEMRLNYLMNRMHESSVSHGCIFFCLLHRRGLYS